jgi:ankyrin repeat protein
MAAGAIALVRLHGPSPGSMAVARSAAMSPEVFESQSDRVKRIQAALEKDDLRALGALLDEGIKVNEHLPVMGTPLIGAVQFGSLGAVKMMIQQGGDLNAVDGEIGVPPIFASGRRDRRFVAGLEALGASLAVRTRDGQSLFMGSARAGNFDLMDFLLSRGSDPNETYSSLRLTAAHFAVLTGCSKCVQTLLRHGARFDIPDADGDTAAGLCHQTKSAACRLIH